MGFAGPTITSHNQKGEHARHNTAGHGPLRGPDRRVRVNMLSDALAARAIVLVPTQVTVTQRVEQCLAFDRVISFVQLVTQVTVTQRVKPCLAFDNSLFVLGLTLTAAMILTIGPASTGKCRHHLLRHLHCF